MTRHRLPVLAATAIAALGAVAATASVDTSPKPGGVYRLKPGIYAQKGTSCSSPANAEIRQYDGRGISTAHSRACRASVLSRRGDRYTVSQSCMDAGAGPGKRFTERQTVTVRDALTFTQASKGAGTTYRYCPIDQLPRGLREAAVHPAS
ncbi:hypothetical protein SAMN05192583_2943 [Sphingomonas gellani]|uniref:Uncharacterized protein n=1 Tax=Sphingomonas gellani TaxID=1166340 RepID=A0A1H8H5I5_9SPHN|nr:hypothetical protein [Sphingomonas gellani]SEN51612.1 hypothetical protein SAMN05192583_2943 [Sphingomonas gellani]